MVSLSPTFFLFFLLFFVLTIFHFRHITFPQPTLTSRSPSQFRGNESATSSQAALQNKTNFQHTLPSEPSGPHQTPIDEIPYSEFGPSIRQVSMLFSGRGDPNQIDEESFKTHIEHGKQWGYPTHILRQNVMGSEDWLRTVYPQAVIHAVTPDCRNG